jgi:secreted protein with Ig-like and vWFA domain
MNPEEPMNLNPDSPELTAFALGELPADEMRRVAALVAADPALAAEVDAIRACATQLQEEMTTEPVTALLPEQRAIIEAAAGGGEPEAPFPTQPPETGGWWRWLLEPAWGLGLAGAAALAVTFLIWPRTLPPSTQTPELSDGPRYGPLPETLAPAAAPADAPRHRGGRRGESDVVPAPAVAPSAPPPPASVAAPLSNPALPPAPVAPVDLPRSKVSGGARKPQGAVVASDREAAPGMAGVPVAQADRANAAPAAGASPERPTVQTMEPALMRRYGLGPRPGPVADEAQTRGELGGLRTADAFAGERYSGVAEAPFRPVTEARLSTFSIDVDTASYANVRRFLREGRMPPADAVRVEEMINYFRYESPEVKGPHPIATRVEVSECPWAPGHRLARVSMKAREVDRHERPPANLVFLVDVSGSMDTENKLGLVQQSLRLLTDQLTARDHVSIVTYAGESAVALMPANGGEPGPILDAIQRLRAGGSTHGSAGIRTAYALARTNRVADGVNRVILCTDGDFNVGETSREQLLGLIAEEAKSGVFLTVLGFGMGNYNDATMELLADRGNGTYAYIDSFREARKVLFEELESSLVTVAKDVKFQIEFNPAQVQSWRLVGYENRTLANRDFNDDTKDAGDIGAGHAVTALYEIVPVAGGEPGVDPLRYAKQDQPAPGARVRPEEMLFVKVRYKLPDGAESRLMELAVSGETKRWDQAGADFHFTAAVAGFGMVLRGSTHRGTLDFNRVLTMAERGLGKDPEGYRAEFVDLVRRARQLRGRP